MCPFWMINIFCAWLYGEYGTRYFVHGCMENTEQDIFCKYISEEHLREKIEEEMFNIQ